MQQIRRTGLITKSDRHVPVAIVGGGASGTIVAAQLARRGIRSLLIDGSGRIGKGVAYSTEEPVHLLNVRAEAMSALAGEPDHFARAFGAEGGTGKDFAERRFFARYLRDILEEAAGSGLTELAEVTALSAARRGGKWHLTLEGGGEVDADQLVLATGNQEPEALPVFAGAGPRFISNPWGREAKAAVAALARSGGPALLVGTGLTMVDVALSLDAAGYEGRLVALSRRGLAPRSHADFAPAPVARDDVPGGLLPLFRWLRRRAAQTGWRAAIDSLRPHSHAIWQGLGPREQQSFLRHARPWWDVHRHRIAPQVAATVARMVQSGTLEIVAGRIAGAVENAEGIDVTYRRRGASQPATERFSYVFNCTGPLHSIARSKDPLLRSLLEREEVRPDQLGIGLEVDETNRAGEHLWAMGPLTKGRYWEITAVPDIRDQAARVADAIQLELGR